MLPLKLYVSRLLSKGSLHPGHDDPICFTIVKILGEVYILGDFLLLAFLYPVSYITLFRKPTYFIQHSCHEISIFCGFIGSTGVFNL